MGTVSSLVVDVLLHIEGWWSLGSCLWLLFGCICANLPRLEWEIPCTMVINIRVLYCIGWLCDYGWFCCKWSWCAGCLVIRKLVWSDWLCKNFVIQDCQEFISWWSLSKTSSLLSWRFFWWRGWRHRLWRDSDLTVCSSCWPFHHRSNDSSNLTSWPPVFESLGIRHCWRCLSRRWRYFFHPIIYPERTTFWLCLCLWRLINWSCSWDFQVKSRSCFVVIMPFCGSCSICNNRSQCPVLRRSCFCRSCCFSSCWKFCGCWRSPVCSIRSWVKSWFHCSLHIKCGLCSSRQTFLTWVFLASRPRSRVRRREVRGIRFLSDWFFGFFSFRYFCRWRRYWVLSSTVSITSVCIGNTSIGRYLEVNMIPMKDYCLFRFSRRSVPLMLFLTVYFIPMVTSLQSIRE